MPLDIPTRSEVNAQSQAYVRTDVPELSAIARRRSFVGGLTRAFFMAVHDLYRAFKRYADREPFPQTASEGFFATGWWIDITGLSRIQPAPATGSVVATGTSGSIIAAGTALTYNGLTYTTDAAATIVAQTLSGISSIVDGESFLGRFTTTAPHNLSTGQVLTFSGCIRAALNGEFAITVVDEYTIEYETTDPIGGTELEPNPVASGSWTVLSITCSDVGTAGNFSAAASLTFESAPSGVDATASPTFGGIADGSDLETLGAWRERVLEALATDFGTFTESEIKIVAKTVPGVTRVFVRRPVRRTYDDSGVAIRDGVGSDGYPTEGRVRIAFLRDNDADPIPSPEEVAQVRDKIHGELVPAHVYEDDVEVLAPDRYALNIQFSSITPDTPGMRASIRESLREYLHNEAGWGGVLEVEAIRCAIRSAYDADTGKALASYQLVLPTMDVVLPVDAYPVLSSISWSR